MAVGATNIRRDDLWKKTRKEDNNAIRDNDKLVI